jgi:3-dehydrosphinganine reductase
MIGWEFIDGQNIFQEFGIYVGIGVIIFSCDLRHKAQRILMLTGNSFGIFHHLSPPSQFNLLASNIMVWKRLLQNEAVECPSVSTLDPLYIFLISIAAVFILVFAIISLILLAPKRRQKTKELHDELLTHALITGGSSGIGLSVGKELITRKCKFVTLVARNVEKLENAKKELEQYASSIASPTVIGILSVDVSDAEKISAAAAKLSSPDSGFPIVTMLFNVAGTSTSAHIVDTDYKEYERLMSINYLGSAYTTRAFLPYMKMTSKDKKSMNPPRAIMLTCSQAGQVGVFGFTAYSASKFALRGFAEALHMEIAKDNISVQVVYPPDTDTPGFELENIDKPEETRLISEVAGLLQPDR